MSTIHYKPYVEQKDGRVLIVLDKQSPVLSDLLRLISVSDKKCRFDIHSDTVSYVIECVHMPKCNKKTCIVAEELRTIREQLLREA